jgi:hypothetical protein
VQSIHCIQAAVELSWIKNSLWKTYFSICDASTFKALALRQKKIWPFDILLDGCQLHFNADRSIALL